MESYLEINFYRQDDGHIDFDLVCNAISTVQMDAIKRAAQPMISACLVNGWSGFRLYTDQIPDCG